MQTIAKITPADYPDLLAAVEAGIPQRELARRYGCAPSLIARHVSRAKRTRELSELTQNCDPAPRESPRQSGSMRDLLEARIRDPQTSARDLASLTNALGRLPTEGRASDHPSILDFRRGTLILEPVPGARDPDCLYRLMMRVPGGIEHVSDPQYDLSASDALYLIFCALGSAFGLTPEEVLGAPPTPGVAASAACAQRRRSHRSGLLAISDLCRRLTAPDGV